MPIRLFDSLTRDYKTLGERAPGAPPISVTHPFTFYNCGLTVYAPGHIGNFRTFVINDVLRRLLELEFGPDKMKHVRNLTDVDDKTIQRAREEERPLAAVTKQWTGKFHTDCTALNCVAPHVEPTATEHIPEQVDMIEVLMQKGNAYRAADGSVYFKVASFPNYGRLSRIKERELQPGASLKPQAADADEKDDLSDFALWKAHKSEDGDNAWSSPWGRGRPGWHIECSAMIKKHLGETIDLHTGGVDLLFPHHENEIAQSECCNGKPFVRHWYHSEHLLVDGKKMSKSLGNYFTLDDLLAKGFSPMAVRYALLSGHPRKQLNFTLDSLHAAESALGKLRSHFSAIELRAKPSPNDLVSNRYSKVIEALRDDLNMPSALGEFFSTISNWGKDDPTNADIQAFKQVLGVLGLNLEKGDEAAPIVAQQLAQKRWAAKQAKDFATADALRKELAAVGWSMLDGKDGYKLEPLKK